MGAIVCLLRGINVGGHHKIKMDSLRALCESLGLRDVETYLQSGNVIFRAERRAVATLPQRLEDALERAFGFRPAVILRTPSELRDVIARNPFATRRGIDPSRLVVTFLARDPGPEARDKVRRMPADPEELWIDGRELYIYFPNGMARPKLPMALLEKTLQTPGTSRNWNTVTKLFEMAQRLEGTAAP
jgi:uncharacterized protein (DUF1697 family)